MELHLVLHSTDTRLSRAPKTPSNCFKDSQAHRSQVNRDEGRICNQIAVRSEERTGEVQAFLYVSTDRSLLQRPAHCFCDAHKTIREEREQNGVRTARWFSDSHD